MADLCNEPASFWTQANALLRKNLTFQKRNMKSNIQLISFPFFLCLLLVFIQNLVNNELNKPKFKCGCTCIDRNGDGQCEKVCGVEYSTSDQASSCPILSPPEWPALLQLPSPEFRAARANFLPSASLPDESCRQTGSCPATVLTTGSNQSFGESLSKKMFSGSFVLNSSNVMDSLPYFVLGSEATTDNTNFLDQALSSNLPIYHVHDQCTGISTSSVPIQLGSATVHKEFGCVRGLHLWRNSSLEVNDELYKGYQDGNNVKQINEITAAYDFLNSNERNFNVTAWYNSTYKNNSGNGPLALVRVPRSVNLVSNAYLRFLQGPGTHMLIDFIKEMPKPETQLRLDLSSLLGTLFFTWVVLQLFPVVLTSLVYEKEQNLRIMMKMHGLGDGPYWMISYAYFLLLSSIYMFCFVIFGSVIGLKFFTLNDYSIQFVFYSIFINLQISVAFLAAEMFSTIKLAAVLAYICVFGTGLLGSFLFQFFIQDELFPRVWIIIMELFPGFSLYRGLYEFAQYSFTGDYMGTGGMHWGDLSNSMNGMKEVLIIMFVEWLISLVVSYYMNRVNSAEGGVRRGFLFFMQYFCKKPFSSIQETNLQSEGSKVHVPIEKADVIQEREKVEQLLLESSKSHAIICDDLKKVYPGRDGNPKKFAVRGLSLALPRGECFGILGPNGAGKTSFINMMIGLTKETSGRAFVEGLDIRSHMNRIYSNMGVCPQHDLLWETLTGREHLLFYARLKNLKGAALTKAVEESLRSVNLFHGGVGDKQAGKYSGGMKRRLSVAISLVGNTKVVYMDEPSTGLDPASRNNLWNVVKQAKIDRAIILTTHSMEEAEVLCDRLGIFVDGSLQCIGNPKELKGRYGGSYVFTMTNSPNHEKEVEDLVRSLSRGMNRVYHVSGTQKFELPKQEVRIADVFQAVESAKSRFTVQAWGLADATLEDVFIKVARGALGSNALS